MRIFIFEKVDKLTENYHENGALVIVANNLESALKMAKEHSSEFHWRENKCPIQLTGKEIANVITYELAEKVEPKVFIFPDAGCC